MGFVTRIRVSHVVYRGPTDVPSWLVWVIVLVFPPCQAGTGVPSLHVRRVQACACYACDRGSCH